MEFPSAACTRFGLDPSKLQNEELLKVRCYRRLYNIVATDQAVSNSVFRPHLIKELYFLLQITPFIEDVLQENFLNSIEEWYNSNDHKKIQLSKNLQGKVNDIMKCSSKEKQTGQVRPKTGIQWDSTLNPFLRPYTAKMRQGHNPLDKMEKEGLQSTNACTYEPDSPPKQQENPHIRNIVDIEEEWERSQDFTNMHRTLHPEEEPTYEKLLNIIERAGGIDERNSQYVEKPGGKEPRKIQSAMINREKTRQVAQEELREVRIKEANEDVEEAGEMDNEMGEREEENGHESSPAIDMEGVEFDSVKCFTKDKRTRDGNEEARMYTRVNGIRIVRPLTGKQAAIIERLGTYSNLAKNTQVRQNKEDQQFANFYEDNIRKRTTLKRELSRKTESIRMLRPPQRASSLRKNTRSSKQNMGPVQAKVQAQEVVIPSPAAPLGSITDKLATHYDEKQFFCKPSQAKLKSALRNLDLNLHLHLNREEPKKQDCCSLKQDPLLTANSELMSQFKFNPLNVASRNQYNEEVLEDIEKIKRQLGGKMAISSEALMKGLYIDTPVAETQFQVPNKAYMMVSNAEKKKKKKKRKGRPLKKSKGKGKR